MKESVLIQAIPSTLQWQKHYAKYPELKDKGDKYWVSVRACNYVTM